MDPLLACWFQAVQKVRRWQGNSRGGVSAVWVLDQYCAELKASPHAPGRKLREAMRRSPDEAVVRLVLEEGTYAGLYMRVRDGQCVECRIMRHDQVLSGDGAPVWRKVYTWTV